MNIISNKSELPHDEAVAKPVEIPKVYSAPDLLRSQAEARVARPTRALVNPQPGENLLHELLHELQVHQIELEMQNDELRRAQLIIEKSRDRYIDLYEFAPVGYLTLNSNGLIAQANLTGAALLGVDRKKLLNQRFSSYVITESGDTWIRHLRSVLEGDERQSCELVLRRNDDSPLKVRLDSQRMLDEGVSTVRIALTNVGE